MALHVICALTALGDAQDVLFDSDHLCPFLHQGGDELELQSVKPDDSEHRGEEPGIRTVQENALTFSLFRKMARRHTTSRAKMMVFMPPPVPAEEAPANMRIMVIKRLRSVNDAVSTVFKSAVRGVTARKAEKYALGPREVG
jgi:hypothetical protein